MTNLLAFINDKRVRDWFYQIVVVVVLIQSPRIHRWAQARSRAKRIDSGTKSKETVEVAA